MPVPRVVVDAAVITAIDRSAPGTRARSRGRQPPRTARLEQRRPRGLQVVAPREQRAARSVHGPLPRGIAREGGRHEDLESLVRGRANGVRSRCRARRVPPRDTLRCTNRSEADTPARDSRRLHVQSRGCHHAPRLRGARSRAHASALLRFLRIERARLCDKRSCRRSRMNCRSGVS